MTERAEGAPANVIGPLLADWLGDESWRAASTELIAGGKSNLTYRVTGPAGSVVLRRPPLGSILPTAHDMVREHTVMSALQPTAVPVPRMLHLCTDPEVLGAPFYVMADVDGFVARDGLPPAYPAEPNVRAAVATGLVDVLVALHAVDPSAVGLNEFGRPDGYLSRQVGRWAKQWSATRAGHDLPRLDELAAQLSDALPRSGPGTVVHGDYRLDNTMLDHSHPGVIQAVLDWEMSTLGDPLADLGLLLVYWSQADDADHRDAAVVVPGVTALPGFPTRREVAQAYSERSGRDVSHLAWYVAFGYFKLAVVCAGIVARVSAGAMVGGGFEGIASRMGPLVELGHQTLRSGEL